jgi:hypothetical protein
MKSSFENEKYHVINLNEKMKLKIKSKINSKMYPETEDENIKNFIHTTLNIMSNNKMEINNQEYEFELFFRDIFNLKKKSKETLRNHFKIIFELLIYLILNINDLLISNNNINELINSIFSKKKFGSQVNNSKEISPRENFINENVKKKRSNSKNDLKIDDYIEKDNSLFENKIFGFFFNKIKKKGKKKFF